MIQMLHQVGGDEFKFSLVQYSNKPTTEFQLNSYPTAQGVLAHVRAMVYPQWEHQDWHFLTRTHLTTTLGSRAAEGAAQVVVVLADR